MPSGSRHRPVIWVVDDSPLDVERALRVLAADYDVQTFADGSAMLEFLAGNRGPDVLVLDWVMPGVSGIEVCRFLRASNTKEPPVAILLLTMQSQTEQIVEGLAAGANDYLVKPYADPELRARVEALVRWNGLLERAMRAEASVAELLEHAPDPLISIDSEHRITYVNREAQRAFGQAAEALVGKTLPVVLPTLASDQLDAASRLGRPMLDIEIGGQIYSPTVRSLPNDVRASRTIGLRDVTSRRQKETRRLDFYSIIAHDLRSPLAAMLMRTELMISGRRGVLSTEVISDLRKMEKYMRSLVALINDFLDFARMDEAAHKMERSRVDVISLVREIVDDFKPLVDSTHQDVQVEIPAGKCAAIGDRRRLQQVLTNLVANAIKFTPENGRIVIQVRNDAHDCEVSVSDNGPGIAGEVLPTLFQRYTRAPNIHGDVGGTGLGLLIVREIIDAHGGTVGVESELGRGSRFWFRIPAAAATADEPALTPGPAPVL